MIAREVERTSNMLLVVTDQRKPDMYLLSFQSKTDLRSWISMIDKARANAPAKVRLSPGGKTKDINDDREEQLYNKKLQAWEKELEDIFKNLKDNEQKLSDYMTGRMEGFDKVRDHFKHFPVKHSGSVNREGQVLGFNERRDQKQIERIKNLVDTKFKELRKIRRKKLDALTENALKVRDGDLESYFDDIHDLSHASSSSSEKTEESSSSEGESRKPRRVKTYHGTADSQPRTGSIRRHTTLPKMKAVVSGSDGMSLHGLENGDDEEVETMIEDELKNLPLSITMSARDAATRLIKENVKLRMENNKFKSDIAMQELHIASLKSRKTATVETAEKLESLRQKQEEIQASDRKLKQDEELFKEKCRKKEEELEAFEARLKAKESDLESRMKFMTPDTLRFGSVVSQESKIDGHIGLKPSSPSFSPALKNLTEKTESKKRRN